MKVKELIEKLEKLPQDMEVSILEAPEWSDEEIPIKDIGISHVETDAYPCPKNADCCLECQQPYNDGYCVWDIDGMKYEYEERVILQLDIEEDYEIKYK